MDDPALVATVRWAIPVASLFVALAVVAASLIGASLGAQDRMDDAAFAGTSTAHPPEPLPGTVARARLRRTFALVMIAPFACPAVATIALFVTGGAPAAELVGAELGLAAGVAAMWRSYDRFADRVRKEAAAGYSSFERTPFGDPIRGLWTGIGRGTPVAPVPRLTGRRAPVDPMIQDALDSGLVLSPLPDPVIVPREPPVLLEGRTAWSWYRVAQAADTAGVALLALGFFPAILLPGSVPRGSILVAVVVAWVACVCAAFGLSLKGRDRARTERRFGYTTLRGRDQTLVLPRGPIVDAWRELSTDHLWHLDPRTGRVIRPPLDRSMALRDPRVRPPLRDLLRRRVGD